MNTKIKPRPPKEICMRNYNTFHEAAFLIDIISSNNLQVNNTNDINMAWDKWSVSFQDICNKHAPLRKIRVRDRSNPWMTKDILHLMYSRDNVHNWS